MDSTTEKSFWKNQSPLLNFILTVSFSIFIVVVSYKESGGDIFAWFAIFAFSFLQFLICTIARFFTTFNIWKNLLYVGLGLLISVFILLIAIYMGTK